MENGLEIGMEKNNIFYVCIAIILIRQNLNP